MIDTVRGTGVVRWGEYSGGFGRIVCSIMSEAFAEQWEWPVASWTIAGVAWTAAPLERILDSCGTGRSEELLFCR